MGMLARGAAMMARVLGEQAQTVTYSRGAATVEISANATRPLAPVLAPYGAGAGVGQRELDWLISAADLVLDAVAVVPVRGDRIEAADGAVYEVGARGAELGVYRALDATGVTLRVFTQRIG